MFFTKLNVEFLITSIVALILLVSPTIHTQPKFYRVFFKDKGPVPFSVGSSLYNSTLSTLTEKSINRRSKVVSSSSVVSIQDAPVYQVYIDSIRSRGAKIKIELRWENFIVIEADSSLADSLRLFSFVRKVQPTSKRFSSFEEIPITIDLFVKTNTSILDMNMSSTGSFRYGQSFRQAEIIEADQLHRLGITGEGVLLGVFDTGFRWRTHLSTRAAKVVGERDFIQNDDTTANQAGDGGGQDGHGSLVFSSICGLYQDSLIGIAPCSEFLLAKTEDISSETLIEEDYYAAGLEWMEQRGVDITTSSLGYRRMDSTDESYSFEDLDGKTTLASHYINLATKRGVICVTAAGNSGPDGRTISSPADADSVSSVAAVTPDSLLLAGFSSRGPRADGKIKPDIAAPGVRVVCLNLGGDSLIGSASGTSLATPLVAGGFSLILQAIPELRPWELRNLAYSQATQGTLPDTLMGYGILQTFKSIQSYGLVFTPPVIVARDTLIRFQVHCIGREIPPNIEMNVLADSNGISKNFTVYPSSILGQFAIDIPQNSLPEPKAGMTDIQVSFSANALAKTWKSRSTRYSIGESLIPCGYDTTMILSDVLSVPEDLEVLDIIELPDRFTVRTSRAITSLRVVDLRGQTVINDRSSFAGTVMKHVLIPGFYFIHVETGEGFQYGKAVVF